MLEQVLQTISAGGLHSLHQLAAQLQVSDELLESMIHELVRMGYLQPLAVSCDERCQHCAQASVCGIGGSGRAWVLTSSGRRAAQR